MFKRFIGMSSYTGPKFYTGPSKIKSWRNLFKCIYCTKQWFCHKDEFGKMNCKYHTGKCVNGMYICCGKDHMNKGCQERCHSEKYREWYIVSKEERDSLKSMYRIKIKPNMKCNVVMKKLGDKYSKLCKKLEYYCAVLDTGADVSSITCNFKNFLDQIDKSRTESRLQNET